MSIISITDKGKTITYHAHHMRDVIEPVKQYGMFGEQLNAKKKLHTLTFYTEDYYETVTDIIMHLSNQLNDDIKATVHGDTELVIEVNGK